MLPVIAIVGRPNVGKSTLFNRLTRSRAALVSDFPGMTRDRQYGEACIAHRKFIIIDTGGMTNQTDAIDQFITQQAQQAIQEANLVLLVVDGKAGLTVEDHAIVKSLRRTHKPIHLIVNKAERLDTETDLADFHALGLGMPHPISAAHGAGVDTLIESLLSPTKETPESTEAIPNTIRLAIIGRPNVGKSTLTNRMLGEERVIVYDQPGTTRDSIFIPLERFGKHYVLIDTAGVRKRARVSAVTEKFSVVKTLQAIENANVVLFIINGREGVTEQDLKLLGFVLECGKALVIAINKWDGMAEEDKEHTKATLDRHLDFLPFVRIHYISALHGTGVGHLFEAVEEAYASAIKKLSTPQLTRLLQKAVNTHTPPLVRGRRIKLRYAHAGGHNPPVIIIHGNQVESLPDSYKRYLAHMYQEQLQLYGTPVRIEFKRGENPYAGRKKKKPRKRRG
ncbi:MAG: ribosome biogenesis GTPase Der [Gammaproteobacteria bacterium RIFCSPHIGHO2_12_FULL_41_20]|nr:MAG: ribosome biogenesis GTPase Der [Gammaproteobacteria bacterium RIFCSPHIGHO2_12_FULL_41_20]